MTVKRILDKTVKHFKKYNVANPRLDAEVLLSEVMDMERINLYVNFDQPLKKEEVDQYRSYVMDRSKGLPVAYILGKQEFMSLDFKVDQATLIPRSETEHLVEAILEYLKSLDLEEVKLADIGTGSGAIIVSLLKLSDKAIQGIGVDISKKALEVAKENATRHGVGEELQLRLGNLLEPINEGLDILVSNPPYIPREEIKELQREVQAEPITALDGGEDGLDFYREIIKASKDKLKNDGLIAFEIGIHQSEDIVQLLSGDFYNINIIKDYAGIDRVILANKK